MDNKDPFHAFEFSKFDFESQNFCPGIEPEDFHIQVPLDEQVERLSLKEGTLSFELGGLGSYEIGTSYSAVPAKHHLYFFHGTGAYLREPDGTPIFEYEWNGKRRFQGKEFVQEDTLYSVATHHVGWMRADVELVKFAPETEKPEVLLALPKESEEGPLQVTLVATGLIATRWKRESVVGAKFYGLDGKEAFHPMAAALNAMHQHGVRLSEGDPQYPEFGGLFPSKTKDNWAVFSWPGLPGYDDDLLFVLSAIDSARAVPVKCEGHILRPVKSLRFVVVHPHLNLFLVGARLEDDMTMYLGHVRREGSMFKVATYRLRAFEYVWSPTFSRNGNVLLFATSEHDVEKVVFARLEDILSDINRRYPEAKLSLVSLESEVK